MEIFKNYKKYQAFEPQYVEWKKKANDKEAQRQAYLKDHPEKYNEKELLRGKAILNAIDVMDEYSQTNAENMEVATETVSSQVMELIIIAATILGAAVTAIPPIKKGLGNLGHKFPLIGEYSYLIPSVIGATIGVLSTIPLFPWCAKKQVEASRVGRFEAMRKDLSDSKYFAVLSPQQEQIVNEISEDMVIDKEMKKNLKRQMGKGFDIKSYFKSIKDLFIKDEVYMLQKKNFDEKLEKSKASFKMPISKETQENAKKDQQILLKMVEKIDIESQEYAEKTELITNALQSLSLAGGGLVGFLTNKLAKLIKIQEKHNKTVAFGVGAVTSLVLSMMAAKVQKHASRVARFKVKEEMLNNPSSLIYVDDSELNDYKDIKAPEHKKENIFKFVANMFKYNKNYEKYLKENGFNIQKRQKAIEFIELTDKQKAEAEQLQKNTFKTFNKVDEKSQEYAESVETVGEIIKYPIAMIGSLLGMGVGILSSKKDFSKLKVTKSFDAYLKPFLKTMAGAIVGSIPTFIVDVIFTKKQVNASKVADMLAIDELKDYREYVDYDNLLQKKG